MPACALHSILRIACEITHFESGDVTQKKISKEHGLLYDKVPLPLTPKFTLYLQFSSPIFLQGAFITLPEDYQIVLILRSAIWEMLSWVKLRGSESIWPLLTLECKVLVWLESIKSFQILLNQWIFPTLAEFYWYFQLTYKSQAACCVVNK